MNGADRPTSSPPLFMHLSWQPLRTRCLTRFRVSGHHRFAPPRRRRLTRGIRGCTANQLVGRGSGPGCHETYLFRFRPVREWYPAKDASAREAEAKITVDNRRHCAGQRRHGTGKRGAKVQDQAGVQCEGLTRVGGQRAWSGGNTVALVVYAIGQRPLFDAG